MGKKLYVGNLSYDTREPQLRELFEQVGTVESVTVITDRGTGRSKGFGFVEMGSDAEAQEAINRFNGHTLDDRQIKVDEARPKRDRFDQGRGRRRGGGRRRY
ncbi:MAG: RNA recognition motif domain-containing protein [Anaerolineae bacterium]